MKKLPGIAVVMAMIFATTAVTFAQDVDKILGDWKFNAPNVDYAYQTGTVSFSRSDSELSGKVKFTSGYEIELQDVKYVNSVLTFNLYIDYELIKVEMSLENGKLKGKIETGGQVIDITAVR